VVVAYFMALPLYLSGWTDENLSKNSQASDQDSNLGPLENEGVLCTQPRCFTFSYEQFPSQRRSRSRLL